MIRILKEAETNRGEIFAREDPVDSVEEPVRAILAQVKARGDEALKEYTKAFDGVELTSLEVGPGAVDEGFRSADPLLVEILYRAAERIAAFHQHQVRNSFLVNEEDGILMGQKVLPLARVGLYVPGGTAAYPSSVLMNAVPAKVAGVKEIVMVTPPTENLNQAVLAAAKIAGVDRVIGVGGVQAVAALMYGAGFIPRVDKLVGPGSAYVAAAKRMAYGTVDIDMVAGPSEILIVADDTANPKFVAADLMSQAEHDKLASPMLLTTSQALAEAVDQEIIRQMSYLERSEIMEQSFANFGAAIVCDTLERCAELADLIAPEHLEICTAQPRALLPYIHNAGAIFLGHWAPEPLGDYFAGPAHVLPTSGTARFFSPLSVDSFLKMTSIMEFDQDTLGSIHKDIEVFAETEHLTAHANAIKVRFE